MGFCSRLEAGFPLNAVKEGLDYALEGRVDLVYCDANTLRADVFEDEHFADVRIQIRTQGTALFCTCPAFRLGSGCKHLYAAMYAADRRLGCDRPAVPDWKGTLATLRRRAMERRAGRDLSGYFLSYHLDIDDQRARKGAIIHVERQRKLKDGSLSRGEEARLNRSALWTLAEDDREALSVLFGGEETAYYYSEALDSNVRSSFLLSFATLPITLAIVCKTDRLHFRSRKHGSMGPLSWDPEPWAFLLRVRGSGEEQGPWRLSGHLVRGDAETALDFGLVFLPGGLFIHENRIRRIDDPVVEPFISTLLEKGPVEVPRSDTDELLEKLFDLPAQPATEWPEELRPAEMDVEPRACLRLGPIAGTARVWARVSFQYGGYTIPSSDPRPRVGIAGPRVMVRRQLELERAALSLLDELGFLNASRRRRVEEMGDREIASRKLPGVVRTLMERNWLIEAEGKLYRKSSGFRLSVSSGMDWFDLEGHVDFDGRKVSLPVLLAAVKRGEGTVVLDDGSFGVIPEEWLAKNGFVLKSGKADSGKIRYRKTQLLLLDGLLAANDGSTVDTAFDTARQQLAGFRSIVREDPRGEFHGELRPYQAEGLGWMAFLRQFGFGGCLADDMGLGKTVQVLAALESRRDSAGAERRTSLAVVPRSLVFNWKRETARFAPRLRVLDATGPARSSGLEHLGEYDLVLSTYGTLRRDASVLKDFQFDYVILDEAHQIKNASSLAARAARLLRSDHRLALTGTPIENRTSELWSLFEFLNPGFLGSAKVFKENAQQDPTAGADSLAPLRHALRPFILRRTKAQVAPELPERSENTIWCELSDEERRRYDELRDYYRASVLGAIDKEGLQDCRFQALEALLRLRQASCHPGLIDKHRAKDGSAKLDALLGRLEELGEEGHKAIVFSQFTSFLAIVKDRLAERGVVHEYLDGKTRDRESRVKSFQEDPRVKLFLVSLKAGGVGLNLTAAEYVFLLDPWWNPAAEAQAIDRAHRIGQKRRVFAYRLVAKNTIEEKVIELQSRKRALADAIISGENASLADLTREDLEVLLS